MAAPRPRDPEREGVLVFDDAHVVVIDKPAGHLERAVRGARDRHRDGPDPRRVAADGQAGNERPAARRAPHRPRDLGPARVRQDQARGGRARGAAARAHDGAPVCLRRARRGRGRPHRVDARPRSRRRPARLHPPRAPGQARGDARDRRARAARRDACARCASRPARPTRSASTSPSPATRSSARPVYIRDYSRPRLIDSPRLLLHAATLGFVHPVTGETVSLRSPLPPDFTAVVDRLTGSP